MPEPLSTHPSHYLPHFRSIIQINYYIFIQDDDITIITLQQNLCKHLNVILSERLDKEFCTEDIYSAVDQHILLYVR